MILRQRHRQTAREVLALLARERAALIDGDADAIARVAGALGPATAALEALPPSDDHEFHLLLARLRDAADRNRALAGASRRGLRAAARIRVEYERARAQLNTYSGDGSSLDIAAPRRTADRRT